MNPDMNERLTEMGLEPSTGCWIDGHWGWKGVSRLIEIAEDYGFQLFEDDMIALLTFNQGDEEFYDMDGTLCFASDWILGQGGIGDDAEAFLNQTVARPGFMFAWMNGEFFYMNEDWFCDEDFELDDEVKPYFEPY